MTLRKLTRQAAHYLLIDGVLYKRGFSLPLLKCLTLEDAEYVLREIHEGICGSDTGARTLMAKTIRQGYNWPSIGKDTKDFIRKCDNCQRYADIIWQPTENLTPISSPWPFSQWGIDLIGTVPIRKGQTRFAMIAVDYFTKWQKLNH